MIRNILFNITFAIWTILCAIAGFPVGLSKKYAIYLGKFWAKGALLLLKYICNIYEKGEFDNKEFDKYNLIFSKHQSALETIYLLNKIKNPAFVIKNNLTKLPFYGWYLENMGMIPVSRVTSGAELKQMNNKILKAIKNGKTVIIFPQGTRTKFAEKEICKYHLNSLAICSEIDCKIGLVALNTGKFWPKGMSGKRAGQYDINIVHSISIKCDEFAHYSKDDIKNLKSLIEKEIEINTNNIS